MQGKWVAIGAIAVLLGAAAGALSVRMRRAAVPVAKAPAARTTAGRELVLSGRVRPQHIVLVSPPNGGMVDAVTVEVGQDVYEGEVLARVGAAGLESARQAASQAVEQAQGEVSQAEGRAIASRMEASRAGAAMERAQAELERAKKAYDRQKVLNDAGATPRLVFEKAEQDYLASQREFEAAQKAVSASANEQQDGGASVANARKQLTERNAAAESAQLAYAASEVRSPVDGVLVAVHAAAGKNWDGSGAMFEIGTDTDALEVALDASPEVSRGIRTGMPVSVAPADAPGSSQPGVVREVSGSQIIVEFHKTIGALQPGAQVSVRLKVE